MKLGKWFGRIGFVIGFVGSFLFYASPFSWSSFESHFGCPWCPYIDVWDANWLTWVELGLTVGLVSGLLIALVGFSVGFFVALVRSEKTAGLIQIDPLRIAGSCAEPTIAGAG